MKLKLILFLFAFFVFAQNSFAQTDYRGKLEFNLSVNQMEWYIGSQVTAKITVKNISDEKLELTLMPYFELVKKEIPKGEFSEVYTYVSNQNPDDSKIFFEFSLNKNESKTVEVDVTKLGWRRAPESIFFGGNWRYEVPRGEYALYFEFWFEFGEDEKKRRGGIISSNKIDVKLNSEK